jgi:hypothetical protein
MPTATYIALANTTLSSATSTVTFSSIPATYRDLVLVCSVKMSVGKTLGITINDDTGSNYSHVWMYGIGSGSGSSTASTNAQYRFMGENANVSTTNFDNSLTSFQDYSATDKHKTMLTRNNQTGSLVEAIAGRWANTNPITKLALAAVGGGSNFESGSTFALYGIVS